MASYLSVKAILPSGTHKMFYALYLFDSAEIEKDEVNEIRTKIEGIKKELDKKIEIANRQALASALELIPNKKREDIRKLVDGEFEFLRNK